MENFWLYQVEKHEEEQAKQKEQTDQAAQSEVRIFEVFLLCGDSLYLQRSYCVEWDILK